LRVKEAPGPQTLFDWVLYLGIPATVLGVIGWQIFQDFTPLKSFPLWFVLGWLVMLPVHELGHALMTRMLGWYVGQLVIGFGPTLKRFQWGHTTVELRLFPLEGFVRSAPRDANHPRLKHVLIYFAGPGIELVVLGLVAAGLGLDTLLSESNDYTVIALQALCMSIIVGVFVNLFPHAAQTQNGWVANDGLGIIRSLFLPESALLESAGATHEPERDEWQEYDPADWWKSPQ
jgi:membrane-associated protease RseP (regulator of RpoE activity)